MILIDKYKSYFSTLNKNIVFIFCWLLVSVLFGYHKTITYPPLSIHQGAQADRASIAYNYYNTSMNFFLPRVMETGTLDGITPTEFPIVNYTVAIFYKIFGFSEFWYRFIIWCFMGTGLWAAFYITIAFSIHKFSALALSFCWYFGTVLCYYTNNFLPDVVSLSFLLLAIKQWLIIKETDKQKNKILFTIFASLACLIKITSAIFVIAILLSEFILFLQKKDKPKTVLSGITALILTFSWYLYCNILEKKVGGTYFLMNAKFPSNFEELKDYSNIFFENWFTKIYNIPQWLLAVSGVFSIIFFKVKSDYKIFTILSLLGSISFYILMSSQFRYHDYYFITLLPMFLLLFIFSFKMLENINKILSITIISLVCIWGLIDAKNGVRLRYTPNNYWYQTFFEPSKFKVTDLWLKNNSINENTKVLAAFDANPNVLLYLLKRRGYRTFDHSQKYIDEKLNITKNLVTTDSAKFFKMYPKSRQNLQLVSSFNDLNLYKYTYGD